MQSSAQTRETELREQWMRQLRAQAGETALQRKDPVAVLTDNFLQIFDWTGLQGLSFTAEKAPDSDQTAFLSQFSHMAFRNGSLAASILDGQGKILLHACMRRAQGTGGRSSREIDAGSNDRKIPHGGETIAYNDAQHSAFEITASANDQASALLQLIRNANSPLEEAQVSSIREMFPFLFEEEDRALLKHLSALRRQLQDGKQAENAQYRAVCFAWSKANVMLQKKRQIRLRFLGELDRMLRNAREFSLWLDEQKLQIAPEAAAETAEVPENKADGSQNESGTGTAGLAAEREPQAGKTPVDHTAH